MAEQDVPKQVTTPSDASTGYATAKVGMIYPNEKNRDVTDYLGNEGSMGFDRNQGAVRETWNAPDAVVMNMGQDKLPKMKSGGSHNI